jgi:hypothetical protein
LPPEHEPVWQTSVWVQASPSLHVVPSDAAGLVQAPVSESQRPATWHWSAAAQITGFEPAQAPAWQVSDWLQASPSLQAEPSALAGFEHAPVLVLHVPATWH